MVIRFALEAELDAVGELTASAYGDLVSDGYADLLRDAGARARDAHLLVCIDEGRLVGTATFVEGPGPMHEIAAPARGRVPHARRRPRTAPGRRRGHGARHAAGDGRLAAARGKQAARLLERRQEMQRGARGSTPASGSSARPQRDWSPVDGVTLMAFERELG